VSSRPELFIAEGEVIKFPGFLKVYLESTDEDAEEDEETKGMLPPLKEGQSLQCKAMEARHRFSQPPPRYTEASLVKRMEELGIGRPSTYAPTISTIQQRGYVKKETKEGTPRDIVLLQVDFKEAEIRRKVIQESTGSLKGKLVPTDIGILVNDYLTENFARVMDYHFTANIEKELDRIAEEGVDWVKVMDEFYRPFHQEVEASNLQKEKIKGERILGTDPQSGKPVIARIGRFGPIIQIGQAEDDDKPRFASLLEGQSIHTITLEEALDLFKLPRKVGEFEGLPIMANTGKFGPYLQHGKMYVSLKDDSPFLIDEAKAIELIKAKRDQVANSKIAVFNDGIEILNGRFGPYIKRANENFKIPKGTDPYKLTEADCLKIIASAPEKKPSRLAKKKT
jgi:DNA topoisomerase-1